MTQSMTTDVLEDIQMRDDTIDGGGGTTSSSSYTISIDSTTNSYGTTYLSTDNSTWKTSSISVAYGTKVYVKCTTTSSNYVFSSWSVSDCSSSYNTSSSTGGYFYVSKSATVSATYTLKTYSVTTVSNDNIKIYVSKTSSSITSTSISGLSSGTTVYVRCVPNGNGTLNSWSANYGLSPSGTTLLTGGYFTIGTNNVTVSATFISYWEDGSSNFRTVTNSVLENISEDIITYESFTVHSGYSNTFVMEVSSTPDVEGMFLSKSIPVNWNGKFNRVSSTNTLYSLDSYLSKYDSTKAYSTYEVEDLPEGTYYVAYRFNTTDLENISILDSSSRIARYSFTETEKTYSWVTDDEGYKRIDKGTDTSSLFTYNQAWVSYGHTGTIILESSTEENCDGIYVVKGNSYNFRVGPIEPLSFTYIVNENITNLGYATGTDDKTTITNLEPGLYYAVAYWDDSTIDGDNWVRYKLTLIPNKHTITFYSNGGSFGEWWGVGSSTTSQSRTVEYNSTLSFGNAKKTGYKFTGWYTDSSNGIQVFDSNGSPVTNETYFSSGKWIYDDDIILYAHFSEITYTVIYDANCDLYTGYMANSTFTYGKSESLTSIGYIRDGYVFEYWTTDEDGEGIEYEDCAIVTGFSNLETVTLYAQWDDVNAATEREEILISDYDKMSINGIKTSIENNYFSFEKDSKSDDLYKIKIINPDSVDTLDLFTVSPVMESNKNIISSMDITMKSDPNDINLKIINRYSGYYNPIFRDVLFFNDESSRQFSNTSFDDDYEDEHSKFGVIKNMWFHKVNDEKTGILGTKTPKYPLTGEYAIDFRDYNIFSTNWDIDYYTRQTDINDKETCYNTVSMKEGLCMFGSRYLNVPEYITLECFENNSWDGEWNDSWISNTVGCPGEVMFKEINNNSVNYYFFIRKRLIRFFCEKLKDEFEKYINPAYSYGKINTLDDDIEEYVEKNVLKLYELKRIRTFVKRTKMGVPNSKIENEYGENLDKTVTDLKKLGFIEINNVTLSKKSTDDFDRQLTYNLRNGEKEDFGFQILIKKI